MSLQRVGSVVLLEGELPLTQPSIDGVVSLVHEGDEVFPASERVRFDTGEVVLQVALEVLLASGTREVECEEAKEA